MAEASQGIFQSVPVRVQEEVAHWNEQVAKNPLWSDSEREIISQTVQVIQGKNKKDALTALQEQINSHDGMSNEACFARMFSRHLKYGR